MKNSWKLLSVRGIDIRMHITFPLILVWAGLQFGLVGGSLESAAFGVVAITLLFVLVTLHELGHSFAAMRYGVPVHQIVLTPIGGVAQLARMPDKPGQEFVIAIAGPAVNFAFAVLMGLALLVGGFSLTNPLGVVTGEAGFTLTALFSYIFFYNIFLALFNLLPAFPLDGGRVLRSLLAMRLEYVKATNIAATIGRMAAVGLGLYALFTGSIFLVLIAVFIFMAAGQEAAFVRARESLRGYRVQHVFSPTAYRLQPDYSLQQAANMMMYTGQKSFPVVLGDRLIGFVPQAQLQEALRTHAAHEPVTAVMLRDVQPVTPTDDLFDVQERMVSEKLEALPVVADTEMSMSNGRYLGLITLKNIAQFYQTVSSMPNVMPGSHTT